MIVVYVVSDQQGAGKTAICATLAHALRRQGKKASVFKPIAGQGLDAGSDDDPRCYRVLLGQKAEGWPIALPEGGVSKGVLKDAKAAFDKVSDGQDVVLVEASNSLSGQDHEQLVNALGAYVLVVARYRRDLEASELKCWYTQLGDRLLGVVVNALTRHLGHEARTRLLPAMESQGLRCLGLVPEDRRLLGVTVAKVAEHLGGRFVVLEGGTDSLVENIMVGGWTLDNGELYFRLRNDKAVVVRGDRPDIQMAALATPTACIVATKGFTPIEYVRYEAEEEEVPIMVVDSDTLTTMSALEELQNLAAFDHAGKLERFGELLGQHVDLSPLEASLLGD